MKNEYKRVIPRDLFNESSLLKCIGKLVLDIHDGVIDFITFEHEYEPFNIVQDDSGYTYISNIQFYNKKGAQLHFIRPVNSRDTWPLYLETGNDSYSVFDDNGNIILTEQQVNDDKEAA